VLSFGQIGAFLGPSAFAFLLRLTGSYGLGWVLCAVPALWLGVSLLRPRPTVGAGETLTRTTAGISRGQGESACESSFGWTGRGGPSSGKCRSTARAARLRPRRAG